MSHVQCQSYHIWDNDKHIALLQILPNSGFFMHLAPTARVVYKKHSYISSTVARIVWLLEKRNARLVTPHSRDGVLQPDELETPAAFDGQTNSAGSPLLRIPLALLRALGHKPHLPIQGTSADTKRLTNPVLSHNPAHNTSAIS